MPITRRPKRAPALAGVLCVVSGACDASDVLLRVVDADGAPVPEVAVFALPASDPGPTSPASGAAVTTVETVSKVTTVSMNQSDLAFSPHLLIVETGTPVAFPNQDDVRHHVYSFSPAKRFQMTIDSRSIHADEIVFDAPGIVTLGCNIHDNMLAYILVVDTPHFSKTDATGTASLASLGRGEVEIHVWTPRLSDDDLPRPKTVTLEAGQAIKLDFRFDDKLFPPHEHSDTSLHWSDY